jgi:parallel beta-helix repeat protein
MMSSKLKTTTKLSAIALAALVTLLATPANAATMITTCPYTITAAGTYVLGANLSCPGTDGIDIQASNVTLLLNTHQIIGNGNPASNGILVNNTSFQLTNVRIEGPGVVQNFGNGIRFVNVTKSLVTGVVATLCNYGLVGETVMHVQLTHNVTTFNNGGGISLRDSTSGLVHGNVISGDTNVGSVGLYITTGGSLNQVQKNTVTGNQGYGIVIANSSSNNLISNTVSGNSEWGIQIYGSSNTIQANTALGNNLYDLVDSTYGCDADTWSSNTFINRNQSCIN